MSDPLSVTASIAGLIGLSGQIITALNNLYTLGKSAKNAPESISRFMEEMQEMNVICCQVQLLVSGVDKQPSQSRLTMITLQQLVATLSGCVLVCSTLDKYISEVQGITDPDAKASTKLVWERIRWAAWKESEVATVLETLQRHKQSLTLMLNILQCDSASEARDNLAQLYVVIEQVLQTNHAISSQNLQLQLAQHEITAQNLKMQQSQQAIELKLRELIAHRTGEDIPTFDASDSDILTSSGSIPTSSGSIPTVTTATTSTKTSWTASLQDKSDAASIRSTSSMLSIRSLSSFRDALENSRVYRRVRRRGLDSDSVFSVESSGKGCGWSMLSDMSLGQLSLSEISVLELPICLDDLWDSAPYRVDSTQAIPTRRSSSKRLSWSSKGRIHNAIASGNEYVVRTLLALGSDIEERDQEGKTPLAHAFLRNREAIVKLLLEKGAKIEGLPALGPTINVEGRLESAIDSGSENVVRLLLALGADLEERMGNFNMTPLLNAANEGKLAIVKLLLEKGADVNARDSDGWTVLHLAAQSVDAGMLQILLDNGALHLIDVTAALNDPGDTPLHIAARWDSRLAVAQMLVERGARVNPKNDSGATPYQLARRWNSPAVAKYLWSQLSPDEQAAETPPRE